MVVNSQISDSPICNDEVDQEILTASDVVTLVGDLDRLRVAVAGDFCLDAYWQLDDGEPEHSIETNLPILRVADQRYTLGGAGNVVANLVDLGVGAVKAIGVHGSDPFGNAMLELLGQYGADTSSMHDLGAAWQTMVYAKPYLGDAEQRRIDFGTRTSLPEETVNALLTALDEAAGWADAVVINQQVVSGFAEPAIIDRINIVIAAHPNTVFVVDARDASAQFLGAVLKVNTREAQLANDEAIGPTLTDDEAAALAVRLAERTGRPVFITRGEHGIVSADASGTYRALGIDVRTQTDPVGAGDTVVATVATVLGSGNDVASATSLANIAASVTVAKIRTTGTAAPGELATAAENADYVYAPDLAENPARARYLEDTEIEVVARRARMSPPSHAIFDFDGTLSTLREGWETVMEPMMIEAILGGRAATVDGETLQRVRTTVGQFIDRTTGIQTLVQMQGLIELVRRFRFVPDQEILDEHQYKAIYNDALMRIVHSRLAKLDSGQLQREDFQVTGARHALKTLREHGVELYLASGTDVDDVRAEAEALGFAEFFAERIYGAVGDVRVEAKRVVIERIFREGTIDPSGLVTFGDGPVELRETRRKGGFAVGVCSDERRRHGYNLSKRPRLIRGGANVLVPDFSVLAALLPLIGAA